MWAGHYTRQRGCHSVKPNDALLCHTEVLRRLGPCLHLFTGLETLFNPSLYGQTLLDLARLFGQTSVRSEMNSYQATFWAVHDEATGTMLGIPFFQRPEFE